MTRHLQLIAKQTISNRVKSGLGISMSQSNDLGPETVQDRATVTFPYL